MFMGPAPGRALAAMRQLMRVFLAKVCGPRALWLGLFGFVVTNANAEQITPMGFPGLVQTPVARMPQAGSVGLGFARQEPYDSLNFYASPFDWLHASVRYTDTNVAQSRVNTVHDKGINLQFRLAQESLWRPQIAVGLIDAAGTGLFSSEYLVMNKRIHDFDFSLGMGWGRFAAGRDMTNPLGQIDDRFETRESATRGEGGVPAVSSWFSGREVALFGGVRYSLLGGRLDLKAEWEGNDYSDEFRRGESLKSSTRLNVGADYSVTDNIKLKLSYERGEVLGFGVLIHASLNRQLERSRRAVRPPKPLDEVGFPEVRAESEGLQRPEQLRRFHQRLREDRVFVHALDLDTVNKEATVWQTNNLTRESAVAAGRSARALLDTYGREFEKLNVVSVVAGRERSNVTLDTEIFRQAALGALSVEELLLETDVAPVPEKDWQEATYTGLAKYPTFAFGITPALRSNIGGPVNFYVGQLQLKPFASIQLSRNLNVTTSWAFDFLYDDFDRLQPRETSLLPPVRTDLERYQRESGGSYLDKLEANYYFTVAPSVYGRVSAGIFEEMYGGIGHEMLYMPPGSRFAVGYNINRVKKRDFDLRFGFQDFEATTGHVTGYYESPFSRIRVVLSVGRYLAGDTGATLDLSKSFRNGLRFGVFATKTNVSSREFGEGSFDKGVYMFIPINVFSTREAAGGVSISHRFILRDGGAKVSDGRALYPTLSNEGVDRYYESASEILE